MTYLSWEITDQPAKSSHSKVLTREDRSQYTNKGMQNPDELFSILILFWFFFFNIKKNERGHIWN